MLIGFFFQVAKIRFRGLKKKMGANKVVEVVPYSKLYSD